MATATQNWLGVSINFENVEDQTSESNFELLPEGFYKAQVKNLNVGVIGANNKPALIVTLELEDSKKEITHNLFLPENGDSQSAIEFKNKALRNFFTRCYYSSLTKQEYDALDSKEKNDALTKIQTSAKGPKQFINTNVLVDMRQEPFIAQDKETKAIRFTDVSKMSVLKLIPKQILKLIAEKEEKGIDMSNMPVILFSNRIAACGFGFYNDFDESIELKNSKSYDFIQENVTTKSTSSSDESTPSGNNEIPNF